MLSAIGTRMTNFAVGIWVWVHTGSATDMALLMFTAFAATIVCSPVAGSLVDRWSRRLTIMLSDIASAVITAGLLALYMTDSVHLWQLYAVNALTGAFLAFQAPAYRATITTMIEKGHYVRANAMMGLVIAVPDVFAPVIAAGVLAASSINGVLLIDTLSYLVAIAMVFLVQIPAVPERGADDRPDFWRDMAGGFRYIARRPPLLGLLGIMFVVSFLAAFGWVLLAPMVLASTHNSAASLGVVLTIGAIGGSLGGIALTLLPPTRDKMLRMLVAILVLGLLGRVLFGVGHSVAIWAVSLFFGWISIPFIDGYNQAIWQEKVPAALQGRVFAAGQVAENLALPIALGLAGPLADHYFQPAMRPGGSLVHAFGPIVGTGPGAGIAVMFLLSGVLGVVVGLVGFALPAIRRVESLLPDQDETAVMPDRKLTLSSD